MKYNFGMLKGRHVIFRFNKNGHILSVGGTITKTKQNKNETQFYLDSDRIFTIKNDVIPRLSIRWSDDSHCSIVLCPFIGDNVISGFVGFTMFDTMGFPVELTREILLESNYWLDGVGFEVLRQLQKEMNLNTFKNKDAFGKGETND